MGIKASTVAWAEEIKIVRHAIATLCVGQSIQSSSLLEISWLECRKNDEGLDATGQLYWSLCAE